MINFIIGSSGRGKSRLVCDRILDEIENGSRDVVLIVPEQQAVSWETRMSELLPTSSNLRLEITNFTRLTNSVFRVCGGLSDTVVDEGSRSLMIWRAMLAVRDQLKVYTAGDNGHEDRAIPFLTSAVDELKQSGITPMEAEAALEELSRLNEADGDGQGMLSSLIARLSDAVNVYAAYNAILHEDFIDRGDLLDNLASALRTYPYFKGKTVFIDSFFSMTAPEERILELIMAQADDVTITFACPDEEDGRLQFGEVRQFMKKTAARAARAGKEIKKTVLTENYRHDRSAALAAIEEKLFDNTEREAAEECEKVCEDVKIIKCADKNDEAEACASIIGRLMREGYRCSDIAVVARDMSSREGIIDTVLRRHGIPCFMSESSAISTSPAVKLVLAALAVESGGWQRRDVIRLIKTGMTPCGDGDGELGRLEAEVFETYTYTWGIRGRKMYCADRWIMNPEGYSDTLSEKGEILLRTANECRSKMIPPLDRLLSVFGDGRGVAPVREIAERIVAFAEEYKVGESLAQMSESYSKIGMAREADRTLKSWDYVCEILDKMVSVLGDTPLNVTRFSRLFGRLAADMDKGTIPTGVDEVVLGSATGVRFDEVRCVIIVGALEDEFPRSADSTGGFFDDRDKVALETVGVTLSSPDADTQMAREFFMFYRMASAAREKLFVLAPTGEGTNLSAGAVGIGEIVGGMGMKCTETFGAMPLSDIVYDKVTAEYLLSRRSDGRERELLRRIAGETAAREISLTADEDRLEPKTGSGERMSLSQSAINEYVRCRFKYCCSKMARIAPDKKAEIDPANIGTFIHHVFELFFSEIPAEKITSGELTRDEMNAVADTIIKDYVDSLAEAGGRKKGDYDGRLRYLFDRLSRYVAVFIESLTEELRQSRFIPVAFEQPIGMASDGKAPIKAIEFSASDGTAVSVRGKIDRLDVYDAPDGKRYIRIVDYKTGKKQFSLDDVKKGTEVQLLIYLFSAWKYGLPNAEKRETVPAGAMYFNTKTDPLKAQSILSVDENRQAMLDSVKRSGVLLEDEEILRAMEKDLGGQFISAVLKNGELCGTDKETALVSAERFGELYRELDETITRIADEMRTGQAEAKPNDLGGKSPCGFCDYAYICKAEGRK